MATNTNIESYLEKIKSAESGGNKYAKNPYGSASGLFQFTKGTWKGLGYDWDDRFDTNLQHEAAVKFTNNNANYLRKNLGIEPTHADLYGAHFLGAVGYKNLYKTSDDRPISDVMSSKEIASNPFVKGKTVGYVKEWLRKKTGEKKGKATPTTPNEPTYDETPVKDYYSDSTLNLTQDSGEYMTAPEYEAPSEYEEDMEGNLAKEELKQSQQEKNFVDELYKQQQQQQPSGQNYGQEQSAYQLYTPELPEFQAQQAPSYFQVGGEKWSPFKGLTKEDFVNANEVKKPPLLTFKPSKDRYKNVKIKDERLEGLQVKDNTNTYQVGEAKQLEETVSKDKNIKKQADKKWDSLMALDKDVNKALEKSSVIELQKKLYSLGYDLGDFGKNKDGIDGLIGGKTKKALELYKKYGDKVFEGDADNPLSLEQEERVARFKKPEEKGLELSDFKPGVENFLIPVSYPLKVAGKLIGSIPGVDYLVDNAKEYVVNPIKTKASEFLPYNLQYKPELNTTGVYDDTKDANKYLLDNMSLADIRKQKNISFLQISKNKLEGNSILPTTLKERITNSTNAQGYMPDYETKDGELNLPFFDRLADEKSKTEVVKGLPGDKGNKRDDIYRMYSGLPQKHDTFTASSFKAGADSDTNVTFKNPKDVMDYLKIAATHTDLFERLANGQITPETIARDAKSNKKGAEKINKAAFRDPKNVMWNATFGVNFDKQGNPYLSFYDNWDLAGKDDIGGMVKDKLGVLRYTPTGAAITTAADKLGSAFGKPIEVYDRIPLTKELVQKLSKLNYKFGNKAESDAISETDEKGNEAALNKVTNFIEKDPKLKKEYERLFNMVAQRYK